MDQALLQKLIRRRQELTRLEKLTRELAVIACEPGKLDGYIARRDDLRKRAHLGAQRI